MLKNKVIIYCLFFFLIFSNSVYSQSSKSRFKDFSISTAIKFDGTVPDKLNPDGSQSTDLSNSFLYGIEAIHRINKYFATGASIFFSYKGYLELSPIQLRIFIIPEGIFQPYTGININYVSSSKDSFFAVKIRLGSDIVLFPNFALSGDFYLGFDTVNSEALMSWGTGLKYIF